MASGCLQHLALYGFLLLIFMAACQPDAASPLAADSSTQVDLAAPERTQVYSFRADPNLPTLLEFAAENADTPFVVAVQDTEGKIVAQLESGTLKNATLTIPPDNGQYQVTVSSSGTRTGRVLLSVTTPDVNTLPNTGSAQKASQTAGSTIPASYTYTRTSSSGLARACTVSTTQAAGATLREGPSALYGVVHVLPPNRSVAASAQTDDGWYRVMVDGLTGWVQEDSVTLNGLCSGLPVAANPAGAQTVAATSLRGGAAVPGVIAAYDPDSYYFAIDRNAGGEMRESISYPDGDTTDRLLIGVANPPDSGLYSRTFTLTLSCTGTGAAYLRWGMAQSPTLMCGDQMTLPFSTDFDQQNFVVTLPGGIGQSYVDYTLLAQPSAPADLPVFGLALDRDTGGQFGEVISYPDGDQSDQLQLIVANLTEEAANDYREYYVTLICDGLGAEYVRWGAPDNLALVCGDTVAVPFSFANNRQNLKVSLLDGSPQSYVDYKLRLQPAAPVDSGTFYFSIDRDGGGQFNETISYPAGDSSDTMQVMVANLSERAPYNFREFNLTLYCTGAGTEHVRWGAPDNTTLLCGQTVKLPFLFNSGQSLAINVPQTDGQSYVHYTLVAKPVEG